MSRYERVHVAKIPTVFEYEVNFKHGFLSSVVPKSTVHPGT